MKGKQLAALMPAILAAVALTTGVAQQAVADTPVEQRRVLGFLSYLPDDYQGIRVAELRSSVDAGTAPFLLDVREPEEFATGYVRGAINIPIRTVPKQLSRLPASKSAEIVVICPSGFRSAMVTMTLTLLGYTNVKTMTLGMREWSARGYPVVKPQQKITEKGRSAPPSLLFRRSDKEQQRAYQASSLFFFRISVAYVWEP